MSGLKATALIDGVRRGDAGAIEAVLRSLLPTEVRALVPDWLTLTEVEESGGRPWSYIVVTGKAENLSGEQQHELIAGGWMVGVDFPSLERFTAICEFSQGTDGVRTTGWMARR